MPKVTQLVHRVKDVHLGSLAPESVVFTNSLHFYTPADHTTVVMQNKSNFRILLNWTRFHLELKSLKFVFMFYGGLLFALCDLNGIVALGQILLLVLETTMKPKTTSSEKIQAFSNVFYNYHFESFYS